MINADKLWVEKYRPKYLNNIVGQTNAIATLKEFRNDPTMPHLLLAGPPGTGKTTTALAVVRELHKKRMKAKISYIELNASDSRGIDVIRTTVKEFAENEPPEGVPFKIVILDEADSMTSAAQQAFRRTMEKHAASTRFILCCNYSNRIILPIQSRCSILRYNLLSSDEIKLQLQNIAEKENVIIDDDGITAIVYISDGDLRKSINYLQACSTIDDLVTDQIVYQISGQIKPTEIQRFITTMLNGNFEKSITMLDEFLDNYGMSSGNLIKQIKKEVDHMPIDERIRHEFNRIIGECQYRLMIGGTERIQLGALVAHVTAIQPATVETTS